MTVTEERAPYALNERPTMQWVNAELHAISLLTDEIHREELELEVQYKRDLCEIRERQTVLRNRRNMAKAARQDLQGDSYQ